MALNKEDVFRYAIFGLCACHIIAYFLPWTHIPSPNEAVREAYGIGKEAITVSGFMMTFVKSQPIVAIIFSLLFIFPHSSIALAYAEFRRYDKRAVRIAILIALCLNGLTAAYNLLNTGSLFTVFEPGIGAGLSLSSILLLMIVLLLRNMSRTIQLPEQGSLKRVKLVASGTTALFLAAPVLFLTLFLFDGSPETPDEKSATKTSGSNDTADVRTVAGASNKSDEQKKTELIEETVEQIHRRRKQLNRQMQGDFNKLCRIDWTNCWRREDGIWMYQTTDKRNWYFQDGALVPPAEWPYGADFSPLDSGGTSQKASSKPNERSKESFDPEAFLERLDRAMEEAGR